MYSLLISLLTDQVLEYSEASLRGSIMTTCGQSLHLHLEDMLIAFSASHTLLLLQDNFAFR